MKKILLFVSAVALTTGAFAQTPTREGNIIIDPYAGIPNWANSILYNNVDSDNADTSGFANYHVNGGFLSYGGRVEYLVADNFGVGIDANYEVSGFGYDYNEYNPVTGNYDIASTYDYKAKKLRIMARFNYHFVQNDRVDAYAGFAGGYKHVNRTAYRTVKATGSETEDASNIGALVPVTLRIAVGTRIYFTDNIGLNLELGAFGGALLQFGLSAKF